MDNVSYGGYAESKELYMMIEINNLLRAHKCTYDECEDILDLVVSGIRQERECLEYETVKDYFAGHKTHDCSNDIITPCNHIEWPE